MFEKYAEIIGPFPDPSDSRPDDQKFHFIYDSTRDYFKVSKAPPGHSGVGKRYYNGSKAYRVLMKYRHVWDNKKIETTFDESEDYQIPKAEITFDESEVSPSGIDTLIFGDSQIQGGIGRALQDKFGGVRIFKEGSSPKSWAPEGSNFKKIKKYIESKPKNIYIAIGGNSVSGIYSLLSHITSSSPNSKITIYAPPPPAYDGFKHKYYDNKTKRMEKSNGIIRSASSFDNVRVVNLHELLNYGYNCYGECDGIHLPESIAKRIV